MDSDTFRRIALGMDEAVEGAHMGHPDFRLHYKIFATLHADSRSGMVKLTPEQQERFIAEHPDAFAPENGAWGRAGCTRVHLAEVGGDALGEAITLAWQNMAQNPASRPTGRRTSKAARRPAGGRSRKR